MSQICPSSSHQLVAASIAFQRARRKFPKNYGLFVHPEDTTNCDKMESVMADEPSNHEREYSPRSSRKCSTREKPSRAEGSRAARSDEREESGSIKENLLEKPIICSCCRKRNEAARANEPTNVFKTRDRCSAGDTLDVVPSKEYNGIAKKGDLSKSEERQLENCDAKMMKSFITESGNSGRCRASVFHSRRRSPRETSAKLDSVNLLYDRGHDQADNVKGSVSSEKRNCHPRDHGRHVVAKDCKWDRRNSRSKVNVLGSRKDDTSTTVQRGCDFHCEKHSTVDLLRRDHYRIQNRHRCCHSRDCSHRCKCCEEYHSCSSKERLRLASDTCLCSSNTGNRKVCCDKGQVAYESLCRHVCCTKDTGKISTVQEQNDEEYDDCVATIDHKDSLCILVEKYKASKKCKHTKFNGETEFSDERTKDECDKSFGSEISCQMEETVDARQREKYFDARTTNGKACRGDCNRLKNLRSRLGKTGTCCSAKGTPWRHSF
ncbi:uncharacterized protein LOC143153658 [Ptiloglossa arizonensis]|uniref:uncharacterized protein LOC143153658 n=1 Tax=Ptiloglossa arizonensis TaxID=3350558 RepID=UPI003FA17EFC